MTSYAPQAPDSKGVALTWITSAAGDRVPPGVTIIVKNTGGATVTVTLATPLTMDGDLAVADRVSNTVAATTGFSALKIPNNEVFRDPSDGLVGLTWSVTGATTQFAVLS